MNPSHSLISHFSWLQVSSVKLEWNSYIIKISRSFGHWSALPHRFLTFLDFPFLLASLQMYVDRSCAVFPSANIAHYGFRPLNKSGLFRLTRHALLGLFSMCLIATFYVDFKAVREECTCAIWARHQTLFIVTFVSSVIVWINFSSSTTSKNIIEVLWALWNWPSLMLWFLGLVCLPFLNASFDMYF